MTWEIAILFLSSLFCLYYAFFILSARKGLLRIEITPISSHSPSVSVLIAARNEQETIAHCLNAVLDQDYPRDRMEVILIDDGSTDTSAAIANNIAAHDGRLRVLLMTASGGNKSSRKPAALAAGMKHAKGEIILTTDADCTVSSNWISSMIRSFDDETVFVAGPVKEIPTTSLISKLSQMEFLGIIGVSAGLIADDTPIICNGANIAFRRDSFVAANGFGESAGFCDDEVLMHRIKSRGLGKIRYSIEEGSIVVTHAPSTLLAFWNQRIRWASKRGHYEDKTILLKLVALYIFFFLLLILLIVSPFKPSLLPFAIVLFGIKAAVDYTVLHAAARIFGLQLKALHFVLAQLLHVPYIVAAAFAGQFSSLEWKGQRIRG